MDEEVIDLRDCITILKRKWWVIAIITTISVSISFILSFYVMEPVYEAQTTLIVKTEKASKKEVVSNDQVSVTEKLAVTYGEIIKSRAVLDEVIKKLDLNESYESLLNKVSISTVNDTQIIKIVVEDKNRLKAMLVANQIPKVFTEEAIRIADANSVEVIDKATAPTNPVKPNKKSNMMLAGVIGIIAGASIVLVGELFDNKIKTAEDATRELGLPVLGVVPKE